MSNINYHGLIINNCLTFSVGTVRGTFCHRHWTTWEQEFSSSCSCIDIIISIISCKIPFNKYPDTMDHTLVTKKKISQSLDNDICWIFLLDWILMAEFVVWRYPWRKYWVWSSIMSQSQSSWWWQWWWWHQTCLQTLEDWTTRSSGIRMSFYGFCRSNVACSKDSRWCLFNLWKVFQI